MGNGLNKLGSSIKSGWNTAKDWTLNSLGKAKEGAQSALRWGGGALNTIGKGIRSAKDWIYKIPLVGVAETLANPRVSMV